MMPLRTEWFYMFYTLSLFPHFWQHVQPAVLQALGLRFGQTSFVCKHNRFFLLSPPESDVR